MRSAERHAEVRSELPSGAHRIFSGVARQENASVYRAGRTRARRPSRNRTGFVACKLKSGGRPPPSATGRRDAVLARKFRAAGGAQGRGTVGLGALSRPRKVEKKAARASARGSPRTQRPEAKGGGTGGAWHKLWCTAAQRQAHGNGDPQAGHRPWVFHEAAEVGRFGRSFSRECRSRTRSKMYRFCYAATAGARLRALLLRPPRPAGITRRVPGACGAGVDAAKPWRLSHEKLSDGLVASCARVFFFFASTRLGKSRRLGFLLRARARRPGLGGFGSNFVLDWMFSGDPEGYAGVSRCLRTGY